MSKVVRTKSEQETRALGKRIGAKLKGGEIIALRGQLGAGKTRFVQGLAEGVGFKARVASPTFTLAREYKGKRLTLQHLDLFRLAPSDLDSIGIDDYLTDPAQATAIEWAEVAEGRLPEDRLDVTLEVAGEDRKVTLDARGATAKRLLA